MYQDLQGEHDTYGEEEKLQASNHPHSHPKEKTALPPCSGLPKPLSLWLKLVLLFLQELAPSHATHDKHLMCVLLSAKNLVLSPLSSSQAVLAPKAWEPPTPAVPSLLLPLRPCAGGWAWPTGVSLVCVCLQRGSGPGSTACVAPLGLS